MVKICAKWDVQGGVIGEVTGTSKLEILWHGERVVDVPPRTVAHEGPVYERPYERPSWQDDLQSDGTEKLPRATTPEQLRDTLLTLVG